MTSLLKHPEKKMFPGAVEGVPPYQRRYRWVMLSLLWLLYAAFGLTYRAIAPLVTPIVEDLHLSYTQMGFILGSWQLTYILVSIIAGTIVDRWGVRKTLLAGTVVIGLSAALRYFPEGFEGMLGAVCLFGVGGSVISIGGPKAISIWFEGRDRGTAIGIFLTGAWVGSILTLALTNSLVMPLIGNRWRVAFLLFGLFTFLVALLWWLFARDAESTASPSDLNAVKVFGRLFKVRQVQIVMALGLLTFATLHGFTNWLPKMLEANALSPAMAGFAASLPLLVGIPSILVVPRLVSPEGRGRFLCFSALGILLALVLAVTTSGSLQLAALLLFGIIISPLVPVLVLILMDIPEVGSAYMGAAGGMFYCVSEIGGFTGPLVMGVLVDVTGGFLAGVFFFAVLCLGIAVLTLSLKNPDDLARAGG
jgi:cyanate permease